MQMWLASVSKFLNSVFASHVHELARTLLDLLEEGWHTIIRGPFPGQWVSTVLFISSPRCEPAAAAHPSDPVSVREADGPIAPRIPALPQELAEVCECLPADTFVAGMCPAVAGRRV